MPLWSFRKWFKGSSTTPELREDDIVVFVVGPSGAGKSSFVHKVTENNIIKIGPNLRPSTAKVQAIRCEFTEAAKNALVLYKLPKLPKNIVFVDTPSFHTEQEKVGAEEEMRSWLRNSKSKPAVVGTVYMHRVETDPDIECVQKHLDAFARTFPPEFTPLPQRLRAVLSYEGVLPEDKIGDRAGKFQNQLDSLVPSRRFRWQASLHPDLFKHDEPATAWQAVEALFTLPQPQTT